MKFENYCTEEKIKHILITTGVSRSNGQVERVNRIVISVLTKLCIDDPTQWYRHVSKVQRALNSTFQRSINTSPFELLIRTKMRQREDIEIHKLLEQEHRDIFVNNRDELRIQAKKPILKVQVENRQYFNNKRKESRKYREGDMVAIKRTQFGVGMKLKPKYLGPYRVDRVKGKDRYDVVKYNSNSEGPIKTSSAADCMKPWPDDLGEDYDTTDQESL